MLHVALDLERDNLSSFQYVRMAYMSNSQDEGTVANLVEGGKEIMAFTFVLRFILQFVQTKPLHLYYIIARFWTLISPNASLCYLLRWWSSSLYCEKYFVIMERKVRMRKHFYIEISFDLKWNALTVYPDMFHIMKLDRLSVLTMIMH